jgi:hypothetical protein
MPEKEAQLGATENGCEEFLAAKRGRRISIFCLSTLNYQLSTIQ